MENLYLIVGLGNPGAEYARTRHNVGFQLVEWLAQRWQASWKTVKKFDARLADAQVGTRRVVLCQPLTFMNASGETVRPLMDYRSIDSERLLVLVDDADLPLGEIRLRPSGGTGGHHGLESLVQHLGTKNFARQRVGIGRRTGAREITDHVLGRFSSAEAEVMKQVLTVASDQATCWIEAGLAKAMNNFNGTVVVPDNPTSPP